MEGLGGGTKGYWKSHYYRRLDTDADADADDQDQLVAATKPPSGKRRKPPTSSRRPKVLKARPRPQPPPPTHLPQAIFSDASGSAPTVGGTIAGNISISRPSNAAASRRPVRRRFWRIRVTPRLAFLRRVASYPARLLRRLQRGYVNMMIRFAAALGGAGATEMSRYSLPRPAMKEYDDKVLVEIYRALVAQGHVLVLPASTGDGVPAARLVAR